MNREQIQKRTLRRAIEKGPATIADLATRTGYSQELVRKLWDEIKEENEARYKISLN